MALIVQEDPEDPITHRFSRVTFESAVEVNLVRDPADPEERYIDAGSSFRMNETSHTEAPLGDCTQVNDLQSDTATYAFTDQPTSYEDDIWAEVDRDRGVVVFRISFSWKYEQRVTGCTTSNYSGENAGGISCGTFLGLQVALTEGASADQIDATCNDGFTAVSGALTLAK